MEGAYMFGQASSNLGFTDSFKGQKIYVDTYVVWWVLVRQANGKANRRHWWILHPHSITTLTRRKDLKGISEGRAHTRVHARQFWDMWDQFITCGCKVKKSKKKLKGTMSLRCGLKLAFNFSFQIHEGLSLKQQGQALGLEAN
ncbi:unnamed protein product [Sphenostylis stenocarpa]|uniref:Uncharacterized protein n=1 Tax=Sphenostylis stenocarpa TaxID=92480 RepID=A0AA86SRV7_9FABA|nr:unnamed protein product [Sphenostylis stenocarpa]